MEHQTGKHYQRVVKTGCMLLFLYNAFLTVGLAAGLPFMMLAVLFSEKRRKTFFQRLGLTPLPDRIRRRTGGGCGSKPVWIHALSVGEVLSALPLVQSLKRKLNGRDIFFSVSTLTGFEVAQRRLKQVVDGLFFFPYDLPAAVRQRVRRIDPALVVMVETDVWPNFMRQLRRRCIPAVLVNARLSDRSFNRYRRLSGFFGGMYSAFAGVCTQSAADAERFIRLGVPAERVVTTGNIKFDQTPDPLSEAEHRRIQDGLGIVSTDRVLLAGSTHEGEEAIVRDVFIRLKKWFPDLKLIIAPRNPKRARQVVRVFTEAGASANRISKIDRGPEPERPAVLVVDTIGLLGRLYALAEVAFVGGSLIPAGGHNPLEAAEFAKPILFGPDMSDFKNIAQLLQQQGAALVVEDAEAFYQAAFRLFSQPAAARRMGRQAREVLNANRGALEKTLQELLTRIEAAS